jgi:adenylate cyclase class IV
VAENENHEVVEFEVKLRHSDELEQELGLQAAKRMPVRSIVDEYYDTDDRVLFRNAVFFRVRNSARAELKFSRDASDTAHVECKELAFDFPLSVSNRSTLADLLDVLLSGAARDERRGVSIVDALRPFVTISKTRSDFELPNVTCSIDEVEGLGSFIELEATNRSGIEWLKEKLRSGSVKNIPIGYVELWLKKNRYPEYLLGRYRFGGQV